MEGALNSESRKRLQEANGEPEPKLLTETHPDYVGEGTQLFAGRERLCQAYSEAESIRAIQAELAIWSEKS